MEQNASKQNVPPRLYGLDWLRFWAILAVVGIHTSDVALRRNHAASAQTVEIISYYAFSACLRFCVPVFLMMAAYLTERSGNTRSGFSLRRLARLAFPLMAATLFYTGITLLQARIGHRPVPLNRILFLALTGRAYYHLWFLFALLGFTLLHGVLRRLTAPLPMRILVTVTGIGFAASGTLLNRYVINDTAPLMQEASAFVNLALSWPYYVLGIWAAAHTARLSAIPLRSLRVITACGFVACILYGALLRESSFFNPATLLVSSAVFCSALRTVTPPPAFVARMTMLSLGIYLWHPFVLLLLRVAQGRYYREAVSPLLTFVLMLGEIAGAVGGSYLIALALSKSRVWRGLAQ